MNQIAFRNLVEEKCHTVKINIEDLLNAISIQKQKEDIPNETITSYKQQIDFLNEELKKVKKENTLLYEEINKLKSNKLNINSTHVNPIREFTVKQIINSGPIVSFKTEFKIDKIYDDGWFSPLLLSNGKIVSRGNDGKSISILSLNYQLKTWNQDIYKENAHTGWIYSFVELTNQRLVSCSGDKLIKIWQITGNDLTEIKTLTEHNSGVYRIILLNKDRFASASYDKTVIIWACEYPFKIIQKLNHKHSVYNLLFLESKNMLISNYYGGLTFWNLNNYSREHTIENIYTADSISSIIELPNQKIALSSYKSPYPIIIIDVNNYSIIKEIQIKGFTTSYSALCLLNEFSFIYVYDGKIIQISNSDYSVLYKTNTAEELFGKNGVFPVEGGKYLIISNKNQGFNVVSLSFGE